MKASLFALMAILLWSTLAILVVSLKQIPPFLLLGIGLMIGSLCGLPWIKQWKVPFSTLLLGLYGIFGYHFFLFMALKNAPPVEANLLNYLWPLLMVLLSPLFFKELKISALHIIASIMGLVGAFLLVSGGGAFQISWDHSIGYLFAVIAGIAWATYSLLSKKIKPFPNGSVGLFCFISGLLSLVCHFLLEKGHSVQINEWPWIIFLGLGPMGAAFFFWDKALKEGDPRSIASLSYLTPMLSTLLLVVFGDGKFTFTLFVSMALIISSAMIGSYASRPKKY